MVVLPFLSSPIVWPSNVRISNWNIVSLDYLGFDSILPLSDIFMLFVSFICTFFISKYQFLWWCHWLPIYICQSCQLFCLSWPTEIHTQLICLLPWSWLSIIALIESHRICFLPSIKSELPTAININFAYNPRHARVVVTRIKFNVRLQISFAWPCIKQ